MITNCTIAQYSYSSTLTTILVGYTRKSYLFRGICSNGPEVGIVPHKLLFETSLEERVHNLKSILQQNNDNNTSKAMNLHNFQARNASKFSWDWSC